MKSKLLVLGAAVVSATLLLSGCTGTSSSSDSISLNAIDGYIPTTVPQGEAIQWLYDTYEKSHPGVTIRKTGIATNLLPSLQSMAQTKSLPDIAIVAPQFYPAMSATGSLRPLNKLLKDWGMDGKYMPSAVAATSDPDGTIGAIFTGTNTVSILYNKAMFASAGITEPPQTWDEFLADAKKLTTPKVKGFMFAGINSGCSTWQFNAWQWSAGGSDDDLTDPGNVKALTFWQSLIDSGVSSKDVVNQCQNEGMNALAQGQVAMIENGPWSFTTLNAAKGLEWGSFPIPVPSVGDKLNVPLGGEIWLLPKTLDAKREAAAADFLKWTQTPEILTQFNERLGYIPVVPSMWPDYEKANPQMAATIAALPGAIGRTTVLGVKTDSQIAALATAIQQVLLGQRSPEQALGEAQKAFLAATG